MPSVGLPGPWAVVSLGRSSAMWSHETWLSQPTCEAGGRESGSSKLPIVNDMKPFSTYSKVSGVPHLLQKPRLATLDESKKDACPWVHEKAERLTVAYTPNGPPVALWHIRQWQ